MLSKENRLAAERDFSRLFAKGKSFNGRGIGLKVVRTNKPDPRIGFVVSTKVSKRAVVRNKIKRRMREAMRPILAKLTVKNIDVAIMARSETKDMTFVDIRRSLDALMEKAGLVAAASKGAGTK